MMIVNCMVVLFFAFQVSGDQFRSFKSELRNIVGLEELKVQLSTWTKGMSLDEKRRKMGFKLTPRKPPHLAFHGNPGTGKTTVARMLGKYLHSIGVLSSSKVVEVQRTDLVAEYVGQTGPKTRQKIEEAMGGILFVDEAYRLLPIGGNRDYGGDALEEIMSVMEESNLVVIFAGYTDLMELLFTVNSGLRRRVTHIFKFDDFTCNELAEMVFVKIYRSDENSAFYGFKLHPSCTISAISQLIENYSEESLRREMNGGLVDHMLSKARENLDMRLSPDAKEDDLITITLCDLEAGLRLTVSNLQKPADRPERSEIHDTVTMDSEEIVDLSNTVQSLVATMDQPKHSHQHGTSYTSGQQANAHEQFISMLKKYYAKYAPILVNLGFAAAQYLGYQFKFSHATALFIIWALFVLF